MNSGMVSSRQVREKPGRPQWAGRSPPVKGKVTLVTGPHEKARWQLG